MNTSISQRPKNESWPAGTGARDEIDRAGERRKCAPHGIMNTVSMSKMMNSTATM